jgi:hypothetical protein
VSECALHERLDQLERDIGAKRERARIARLVTDEQRSPEFQRHFRTRFPVLAALPLPPAIGLAVAGWLLFIFVVAPEEALDGQLSNLRYQEQALAKERAEHAELEEEVRSTTQEVRAAREAMAAARRDIATAHAGECDRHDATSSARTGQGAAGEKARPDEQRAAGRSYGGLSGGQPAAVAGAAGPGGELRRGTQSSAEWVEASKLDVQTDEPFKQALLGWLYLGLAGCKLDMKEAALRSLRSLRDIANEARHARRVSARAGSPEANHAVDPFALSRRVAAALLTACMMGGSKVHQDLVQAVFPGRE